MKMYKTGKKVLSGILAAVLAFGAALYLHRGFRNRVTALWRKKRGDRGISRKMNNARFAQALSMGFSSGMQLEEAVELAFQVTESGQACVLSPAAASCGIFKNFEERGDRFQELVKSHL